MLLIKPWWLRIRSVSYKAINSEFESKPEKSERGQNQFCGAKWGMNNPNFYNIKQPQSFNRFTPKNAVMLRNRALHWKTFHNFCCWFKFVDWIGINWISRVEPLHLLRLSNAAFIRSSLGLLSKMLSGTIESLCTRIPKTPIKSLESR